MEKEKLSTFIRLLQKVQKQPSRTFDLGLIVKEPKSHVSEGAIFSAVKKLVNIERIIYDQSTIDEGVFEKIIEAFQESKWVLLEIKKDLSSPLLNQLKHLANYNSFQLIDYKGKDIFEMEIPEESRVIVFVKRDFIENKISYPHFYKLFGPTLSVK